MNRKQQQEKLRKHILQFFENNIEYFNNTVENARVNGNSYIAYSDAIRKLVMGNVFLATEQEKMDFLSEFRFSNLNITDTNPIQKYQDIIEQEGLQMLMEYWKNKDNFNKKGS